MTTNINYPIHLIPKNTDVIISSDDLDPSHHLGVWVDDNKPFKDIDGKLSPEAIEVARIPKFSTNKIPSSIASDLDICFIGANADYFNRTDWISGNGVMPVLNDFEILNNRNHYFIKISDIHLYTDDYHNPPDREEVSYKFIVNIVHKPLISNYWHFELEVRDVDDNIIPKVKSTWHKLLCSTIRDRIQEKAILEL